MPRHLELCYQNLGWCASMASALRSHHHRASRCIPTAIQPPRPQLSLTTFITTTNTSAAATGCEFRYCVNVASLKLWRIVSDLQGNGLHVCTSTEPLRAHQWSDPSDLRMRCTCRSALSEPIQKRRTLRRSQ